MSSVAYVKCKNVKMGCPKNDVLGPELSSNTSTKYKSECSAGGGFVQYCEVKCLICGEVWETQ